MRTLQLLTMTAFLATACGDKDPADSGNSNVGDTSPEEGESSTWSQDWACGCSQGCWPANTPETCDCVEWGSGSWTITAYTDRLEIDDGTNASFEASLSGTTARWCRQFDGEDGAITQTANLLWESTNTTISATYTDLEQPDACECACSDTIPNQASCTDDCATENSCEMRLSAGR